MTLLIVLAALFLALLAGAALESASPSRHADAWRRPGGGRIASGDITMPSFQ